MTHTAYFHFHLISKTFLSFFLILSVYSSKMHSRKVVSPIYIEFWLQKPYKGKIYFEPCFQLIKKKIIWDNLKSLNKSLLVKKKEKQYRQSGILLFTILKTLDSYLYMKPNLVKNQLCIRSSTSVIEYMK